MNPGIKRKMNKMLNRMKMTKIWSIVIKRFADIILSEQ